MDPFDNSTSWTEGLTDADLINPTPPEQPEEGIEQPPQDAPQEAPEQPQEEYKPDGVQQLVTQGLGAVDGVLGTDLSKRFADNQAQVPEVQKEREEKLEEAAYSGPINTVGTEVLRAGVGGVANAIEGTGETVELIGDAIGTKLGLLKDESDNPWSDQYEAADWNLGVTENKTGVGKFGRGMVSILVAMRQAGRLPGLSNTDKATRVGRLVNETAKGAIADFFVAGSGENLSNMVQDSWLANPLSAALAVDEDDNPFEAKLKNVVEGGIFGTAVDGVGEVLGALRKGQLWFQETGDADEAAEVVIDLLSEPAARATRDPAAANAAFNEWSELARLQEEVPRGSDEWNNLQEMLLKKQEDVPVGIRLQRTTYADDIIKVDGGKKEIWVGFVEELDDIVNVDGNKIISITWDTEDTSLGTGALNSLKRYFNDAFSSMEPGTVVRNTPAPDNYAGTASAAQVRKGASASGQVDLEDFRDLYINRGETPEEVEYLTRDWDARSDSAKESALRDLDYDFRGDLGTPSKFLVDQFKVFKEKMDGQYPLTIGEGADGYTFRSVGEHFKGLTQKARDQVTGMKPPEPEYSNARSRLYQRAGFGPVVDGIHQYGIVRVDKRGTKWLESVNTIDDFERAKAQAMQSAAPEPRPGAKAREVDQVQKGSSPQSDALFEPEDAARRTTEYDPNYAAKSQARAEAFDQVFDVSASPVLTDAGYKKILTPLENMGATDAAIRGVKEMIADTASKIDVDALSKELGQSTEETVAKALNVVRDFLELERLGDADALKALDKLTFNDELGRKIVNREGVVATKTLIKDTAYQLQDIAANAMDGAVNGTDITRQAEMLGDRLKALTRLHKTASVHYSSGLQSFKNNALGLMSPGELDKQIKQADEFLDKMMDKIRLGDPESLSDFKDLANALVLSGGDATKQIKFWELYRKVGAREALGTMYNSMLSSPLSHTRNILGNLTTTTLRPIALSMGRFASGDKRGALAALGAFHGLHDSIFEAIQVGGAALKKGVPVNEGEKFVLQTNEAAEEIQRLIASASTPQQKAYAQWLEKTHNFLNNPWMTLPTRALTAADDAFKTLTARMEIKRQVFDEMLAANKDFNGFKIDEELWAKKTSEMLGPDGQIVDKKLLDVAKENTFQQDLQGIMKQADALTKAHPAIQTFFPFIRTPHNIFVYGASYVPGVNRILSEYKAVMAGDDEVAKSIMKGREALGWMMVASAGTMAMTGMITGYGPKDPEKRKIWLRTNQPHSVKVGGVWVSYKAMEPINMIWSTVADLTEMAVAGADDAYDRGFGQIAYSIAANVTNKTYFQGMANLAAFMDPTELAKGEGRLFAQTALSTINNFFPAAGFRRQLASALDQDLYNFNNEFERQLQSAAPGFSMFGGQEKVDIFTGESIQRGDNSPLVNILNNIVPLSFRTVNDDPVVNELVEKGIDVRAAQGDTLQGIELTAQEKTEIDKLVAQSGLRDDLARVFDNQQFKNDYERWKNADPNNRGDMKDALWMRMVNEVFQNAYSTARDRFAATNPEFSLKVDEAQLTRYRANTGSYTVPKATSDDIQIILDF